MQRISKPVQTSLEELSTRTILTVSPCFATPSVVNFPHQSSNNCCSTSFAEDCSFVFLLWGIQIRIDCGYSLFSTVLNRFHLLEVALQVFVSKFEEFW
jgi:hypothetical protein